ncbi:MAG TPA: hypothetical protein VHF91_05945 [Acidimicrobiales bacterium]|nr:hypothetical protein [Acidimicrobiales bacterium]
MNPNTVVESDAPDRAGLTLRLGLGAVLLGAVTSVIVALVVDSSTGPRTISRITFENPTDYALDIEVSPGPGAGWTSAGSVRQQSTGDVHEIPDQGDVWVFRFDSQGESGGDLRVGRAELEASGWRVTIPPEVGHRLVQAGAPPTP